MTKSRTVWRWVEWGSLKDKGYRLILGFIAGLFIAGLSGCGEGQDLSGLKVYRHALDGTPNSLDPLHSSTIYANHLVLNLYDTLYAYQYLARPYQIKPNLARSMPQISADGRVYRIELKPGVRFIDDAAFPAGQGRELVAADVVYSLLRHFDPTSRSQGAWLWQGWIEGMDEWLAAGADYAAPPSGLRALDTHHLEIHLTQAYPQFIQTLALGFSSVVPHEAVEYYGQEFAVHPVGSGPFRLTRFDAVKAVMVPNPYFRQEPFDLAAEGYNPNSQSGYGFEQLQGRSPPFLDRLEIHFIGEDSTRWNALLKGDEIDYARVPALHFDDLLESRQPITVKAAIAADYHVLPFSEAGFVRTDFDMADPAIGVHSDPQQNARNHALRCALIKAFNWQARNDVFYYGIGQVFPGIIPPATPDFDPDFPRDSLEYDPAGARQLLAQNGWTAENLPTLEYGFMNSVTNKQFYEQLRGFFEAVGYPREKISARIFPSFGELNQAARDGQLMLYFSGWNLDYPDAQNTMQLFYGPYRSPGANTANYQNPEYDQLYDEAALLQPGPERSALYQRMNHMMVNDCVSITGLTRTLLLMWSKEIVLMPDRSFLGGYTLRYADRRQDPAVASTTPAAEHSQH